MSRKTTSKASHAHWNCSSITVAVRSQAEQEQRIKTKVMSTRTPGGNHNATAYPNYPSYRDPQKGAAYF